MGGWLLLALCVVASTVAVPTERLTASNANDVVGLPRFEATLMALAKTGKYELSFTTADIADFVRIIHPIGHFSEATENVVLMDSPPYVPVVEVRTKTANSTVILSDLELYQNFNDQLIVVEFERSWQSLLFVDIPTVATFQWKINNTNVWGRARVNIPHSWVHVNVESACVRDQPSILLWEGRVDIYPEDIDITTPLEDQEFVGALAQGIHASHSVREYVSNALQHQVAKFVGDTHYSLQGLMRDLCLQCDVVRSSNTTIGITLKGDSSCLRTIPSFFWKQVFDDHVGPKDLQAVAVDAIKESLHKYRSRYGPATLPLELQEQLLVSTGQTKKAPIEQLRPRVDPRQKPKLPEGFVSATNVLSPWKKKIGELWMRWHGKGAEAKPTA